jgi:oxalate decarboxylase/phosphoglucose isomerase-like protein (cupin superfamily)
LADEYELASGAMFRDLFVGSPDCRGICGGYGLFEPGASLPCHTHAFDESITIIQGRAACRVAGRKHIVEGCDTALVPRGLPHRFINEGSQPMAMIWVYAGDRPERTIVSQCLCDDSLETPAACDISAGQISYG